MKKSHTIGLIFILTFLIGLQLFLLKSLDYSTSSISWYSIDEEKNEPAPSPDFKIGNLKFNVTNYSQASELEPFRIYFEENCSGSKGTKAASCLSEHFREKIPFGEPSDELFDSNYSPVEDFREHLSGKPGHCVSYSGMTATTLLSVGIPARMVQILPKVKSGHNIIEVWDENAGWFVFDPLSNTVLKDGNDRYLSAFDALSLKNNVRRSSIGRESPDKEYLVKYYKGEMPFDNAVIYPEPWLYTRVGNKSNPFYRGSFVAFGEGYWENGGLQNLLRYGVILCSITILFFVIMLGKPLYERFSKTENS